MWILTVAAVSFRILARLVAYDDRIGYFESHSFAPTIYRILLVLIAILALAAPFVFRKEALPDNIADNLKKPVIAEKPAAVLGILCMLGVSAATVYMYWINGTLIPNGITVFGLVTALLSTLFFAFFLSPATHGTKAHLLFETVFALYFLYVLCSSHFELYTPLNSPVKLLIQLSSAAAVFFLFSDIRLRLLGLTVGRFFLTLVPCIGFLTVSVFTGLLFSVHTEEFTFIYHICDLANLAVLLYAVIRYIRLFSLFGLALKGSEAVDEEALVETEDTESETDKADGMCTEGEGTSNAENNSTPSEESDGSTQE